MTPYRYTIKSITRKAETNRMFVNQKMRAISIFNSLQVNNEDGYILIHPFLNKRVPSQNGHPSALGRLKHSQNFFPRPIFFEKLVGDGIGSAPPCTGEREERDCFDDDMGGVCKRVEQGELHSDAHGCGVGLAVPLARSVHDDAGPSRRACSFRCRYRYLSFQCHWFQPPCKSPVFSMLSWIPFFLRDSSLKLVFDVILMPVNCLMIKLCWFYEVD